MYWYWLLPCLFGAGLYAITVPGTYIYDDNIFARDDPRLYHPREWGRFLREGYFDGGADQIWRPLVSLGFAVEAVGHGDRPWVFHLVNVLLHAIASALVAGLGARVANRRIGLIAGLLFAALPIHVEAVAGIVGRAEEMAAIGILAALLLYIDRPPSIPRALAITGCFLFAVLSKEQGLLTPLLLLMAAKSVGTTSRPQVMKEHRASLWLVILLTMTLAAYISYRDSILPWYWERGFLDVALNPLVASRGADRWLIPISILGRYAALMVAPVRLCIDYSMNVFTPRFHLDGYFVIGLIVLLGGIALAALARVRRWRAALFCLGGFAVVYLMVGNIVLIGTVFAERLMYVPSIFICILIAMALGRLPARAMWPTMILLLALASFRTVMYAYQWNDRMRLYNYSLKSQPKCGQLYLLLAVEHSNTGDHWKADQILAEARRVAPESWQVWMRSAREKIALGQFGEAQRFAREAFHLRPAEPTIQRIMDQIDAEFAHQATPPPKLDPP